MSALTFVHELLDSGRVRVHGEVKPPADLGEAVRELDRAARPELAYEAPALLPEVGEWALLAVIRACQALVYREIEADAVRQALAVSCPRRPSPDVCYSADLAFRVLPELVSLARGVAEQDPLVEGLASLATAWPLSSVGVKGLPEMDISGFIGHPALRRLYADRIIERSDVSRGTSHPAVRKAVREALGGFPELAPRVAAALAQEGQTCP